MVLIRGAGMPMMKDEGENVGCWGPLHNFLSKYFQLSIYSS